jgi:plastocyanin
VKGKAAITLLVVAAIAGPGAADAAAQATNVTVGGSGNVFTLSTVTIQAGQSVVWTNAGGNHNVHFNGEAALNAPATNAWSVSRAFPTAGTFTYVCDIHAPGMAGTVNVVAASAPTPAQTPAPTAPAPTPITPAAPVADRVAPKATRVLASGTLTRATVKLRLDEAATVTARLTRSGQATTLKRVTRKLTAGSRQITLSRTLSNGKRYRIALRIVDAAGNVATRAVTFTARR